MGKRELLESLKERGISDRVVDAINKVHREDFVPLKFKFNAYEDKPLPIGDNATISQPSTVAFMLDILDVRPDAKVLEIGSGSGYVLAILSKLAAGGSVHGIEINKDLVSSSTEILKSFKNVEVHKVNGRGGFLRYAPYDRILVSAAYAYTPYHLVDQLKINGVLVAPVGSRIVKLIRRIDGTSEKEYPGFSFVSIQ